MPSARRLVECTIPILHVRDLARSIRFYVETLGFQLDWGGSSMGIGSVSRDACAIMLRQSEGQSAPGWVWIGLEDDSLFAELTSRGVTVVQPPQNHPWAYEMKFADLDGNILWLGAEPRHDLPFHQAASD